MIRVAQRRWFNEGDGGRAPWYITFSDLLTLLLTFFVLRISMSSLEVESVGGPFT